MHLRFRNKQHEEAFMTFIEEAYLEPEQIDLLRGQERKQFAFLYLIAMYQEAYEAYEGERFYIEALEDISLGGPTYLLEEGIGKLERPHEAILPYAKAILRGETVDVGTSIDHEWLLLILKWLMIDETRDIG